MFGKSKPKKINSISTKRVIKVPELNSIVDLVDEYNFCQEVINDAQGADYSDTVRHNITLSSNIKGIVNIPWQLILPLVKDRAAMLEQKLTEMGIDVEKQA